MSCCVFNCVGAGYIYTLVVWSTITKLAEIHLALATLLLQLKRKKVRLLFGATIQLRSVGPPMRNRDSPAQTVGPGIEKEGDGAAEAEAEPAAARPSPRRPDHPTCRGRRLPTA